MGVKAAILQRARDLQFDDCRVTTADAPASGDRFQRWLAAGNHGQMLYLERNAPKRLDPQRVLPGVRSIVVLAAAYAADWVEPAGGDSRIRGRVARFARYRRLSRRAG